MLALALGMAACAHSGESLELGTSQVIRPRLLADSGAANVHLVLNQDAYLAVFERIFPDELRLIYPHPGDSTLRFSAGAHPLEPLLAPAEYFSSVTLASKALRDAPPEPISACSSPLCYLNPMYELVFTHEPSRTGLRPQAGSMLVFAFDQPVSAGALRAVTRMTYGGGTAARLASKLGKQLAERSHAHWEGIVLPIR